MPDMNWDDLRYLIALHRRGSFAAASAELGQDETTVARRVRRLEHALSAQLLFRDTAGKQRLTELAERLVARAMHMETETRHMTELVGMDQRSLAGTVRVTAVPVVVDRILVPAFPGFQQRYPDITLELVPEGRNLSLTRREADLALRLGPPKTGGSDTLAQRIGWLEFGLYRSSITSTPGKPPQWILYDTAHAYLEQAKWMSAQSDPHSTTTLRVADLNTAIEAVAHDLGQSLLPVAAGQNDVRLHQIKTPPTADTPRRPVWLLSHKDQSHLQAIQAVKGWLSNLSWGASGQMQDHS
ncbi:LysR family transcriptional regulator [Ruegeria sp. EL01]|jgi:DNA-binding transcriptional LysR family regulator|uniref:LysR family transcriptional regulator n=1 Tax=Ruegeria sp. EL01 TaxID=2107578 RepID=UPI000EA82646|nr:LysR family transcriptional regulator [Ruegeria sp. EL01]